MIDFNVQIRNEVFKKDDENFKIQNQNLLEIFMSEFNKNYNIEKKIPLYISFYDSIDDLNPLALIEPDFDSKKISIRFI